MKAFPMAHPNENCKYIDSGMELRDYFAAKVLPALLFDLKAIAIDPIKTTNLAYVYADAMMEARKK
jgi:hypothetical protein